MAITLTYIWPATGTTPPTRIPGTKMIVDVTADADSDTFVTIPHLMPQAPLEVFITPTLGPVFTTASAWTVVLVDGTNVMLKKANTLNSGQPVPQLRVSIGLPNTLEL